MQLHCAQGSGVLGFKAMCWQDIIEACLESKLTFVLTYADAPEMAELGLIAPLGNILSQLSQGGGAKGINIDAVSPSAPCCAHAIICAAEPVPTTACIQCRHLPTTTVYKLHVCVLEHA